MKFITPIIALVSASAVYTKSINTFGFLEKRDSSNDSDMSRECALNIHEYNECLLISEPSNYREMCKIHASDRCQYFYNNAKDLITECNDSARITNFLQPKNMVALNYQHTMVCQMDESNNLCPLSEVLMIKGLTEIDIKAPENKKIVQNTCASKQCYVSIIDVLKKFEREDVIKAFIEECGSIVTDNADASSNDIAPANNANANNTNAGNANSNNKTESQSSGASTVKITTRIFVSLGLLMLSLY